MSQHKKRPSRGIPRWQAYEAGIVPAHYELDHMIQAFGIDNVVQMAIQIAAGNYSGVADMLKHWTTHKHGDKFSMIDYMCDTDTIHGLTVATQRTHS